MVVMELSLLLVISKSCNLVPSELNASGYVNPLIKEAKVTASALEYTHPEITRDLRIIFETHNPSPFKTALKLVEKPSKEAEQDEPESTF